MQKYLGLPPDWSDHGHEIDQLIGLIHWLMLLLFVGWAVYFIYVLFRFRSGRNTEANYDGARAPFSKYIEGGVVVVEAVLLIGFAIPIWASRVADWPAEEEALQVRVVAEQFAWNVHYPGKDGVFGRTDRHLVSAANPLGLDPEDSNGDDDVMAINEFHVPVDRPVVVHLSSKDVIHSFSLPLLRVKQDAVPGMTIPVWFIARQTGQTEIGCAQLCGLGHFRMRGFVYVETQEEVDLWLEEMAEY